jgi:hypothetical protein
MASFVITAEVCGKWIAVRWTMGGLVTRCSLILASVAAQNRKLAYRNRRIEECQECSQGRIA